MTLLKQIHVHLMFCSYLVISGCHSSTHETPSSQLKAHAVPKGQFRPVSTIDDIIEEKIFNRSSFDYFTIGSFINIYSSETIAPILGGFVMAGPNSQYQGGTPNALSIFIYQKIFKNLVNTQHVKCLDPDLAHMDDITDYNFHGIVTAICSSSSEDELEEALGYLWDYIIGYEADSYRDSWLSLLKSQEFETPEQQLDAAVYSVLLNPLFLLEY